MLRVSALGAKTLNKKDKLFRIIFVTRTYSETVETTEGHSKPSYALLKLKVTVQLCSRRHSIFVVSKESKAWKYSTFIRFWRNRMNVLSWRTRLSGVFGGGVQGSVKSKSSWLRARDCVYTVDSRYLELQGTLWHTSRYPYFDISDLRNWGKQLIEQPPLTEWICNLTL